MNPRTKILLVGGSDPLSAAGVAMDLKTIQALGGHGYCVVSTVTAQNSDKFCESEPVSDAVFRSQLECLKGSYQFDAVKIGMLYKIEHLKILARFLKEFKGPVVLDPVMAATAGSLLWTDQTLSAYLKYLFPLVTLITPNLDELLILVGQSDLDLPKAFYEKYRIAVLAKGGHAEGDAKDRLIDGTLDASFVMKRKSHYYRGTGCLLASAICYYLARKHLLHDAVILARSVLNKAMRHSFKEGASHILSPQNFSPLDPLPEVVPQNLPELPKKPFAGIGKDAIGIYPIVASASQLSEVLKGGVTTAQMRIKDLSIDDKRREFLAAIKLADESGCRLFINDDWQAAIELGCYGVHLGHEDLFDADLVAIQNEGLRLGLSTHCYYEALIAQNLKPSYIALGPIFKTTCKSMRFLPQGLAKAGDWVAGFKPTPIVAIGGIKEEHIGALKKKNVSGVAAISAILDAPSPSTAAKEWVQSWQSTKLTSHKTD